MSSPGDAGKRSITSGFVRLKAGLGDKRLLGLLVVERLQEVLQQGAPEHKEMFGSISSWCQGRCDTGEEKVAAWEVPEADPWYMPHWGRHC